MNGFSFAWTLLAQGALMPFDFVGTALKTVRRVTPGTRRINVAARRAAPAAGCQRSRKSEASPPSVGPGKRWNLDRLRHP
jgi:hypothetical protein